MSSLLPLACFGAAIVVIAGAGAAGVWLTLRLSRSERFRRLAGGSERMHETRDRNFFWTGEMAIARANAAREFAANRDHRYRDDAIEWSDGDCTCTLYTETIEDAKARRRSRATSGGRSKTLVFTDLEHTTTVGFERFVDDSMLVVRSLRKSP